MKHDEAMAIAMIFIVILAGDGLFLRYMQRPVQPNTVVSIEIVPDFGGSTYDAFLVSQNVTGAIPNASSDGYVDNSVVVPVGMPVKFVITSIDSAINMNFSGQVTVPFTVYNDTPSGIVALNYVSSQNITHFPVGHTFTVDSLGINVPIPPLAIVTFNYTFTQQGSFLYHCTIPCGDGMNRMGYMQGYIIVKQPG